MILEIKRVDFNKTDPDWPLNSIRYEKLKDGRIINLTSGCHTVWNDFTNLAFSASKYGYESKILASCCGGKGVSIWKDSTRQWECSDCGSPKSNDPDYLYGSGVKEKDWRPPAWKPNH